MNYKKITSECFSTLTPITVNEEIIKNVKERAEKKCMKKTFKIKKHVIAVCAAAAAVMIGTMVAAAESAEFNQFIYTTTGIIIDPDKVVYATPIPQNPIDGFSLIENMGEPIAQGQIEQEIPTAMYAVEFAEKEKNKYAVEKIAYGNGQTIVSKDGFELKENQCAKIAIDADFTAEYHTDRKGELVEIGYIYDDAAYQLFCGRTGGEALSVDFIAERQGEYRFYIINCCAGLQNYDSVSIEIIDMN